MRLWMQNKHENIRAVVYIVFCLVLTVAVLAWGKTPEEEEWVMFGDETGVYAKKVPMGYEVPEENIVVFENVNGNDVSTDFTITGASAAPSFAPSFDSGVDIVWEGFEPNVCFAIEAAPDWEWSTVNYNALTVDTECFTSPFTLTIDGASREFTHEEFKQRLGFAEPEKECNHRYLIAQREYWDVVLGDAMFSRKYICSECDASIMVVIATEQERCFNKHIGVDPNFKETEQ